MGGKDMDGALVSAPRSLEVKVPEHYTVWVGDEQHLNIGRLEISQSRTPAKDLEFKIGQGKKLVDTLSGDKIQGSLDLEGDYCMCADTSARFNVTLYDVEGRQRDRYSINSLRVFKPQ